jgi:hypothetical protein
MQPEFWRGNFLERRYLEDRYRWRKTRRSVLERAADKTFLESCPLRALILAELTGVTPDI